MADPARTPQALALTLLIFSVACSRPPRAPDPRAHLPAFNPAPPSPSQGSGAAPELIELSELAPSMTACEWLSGIATRPEPQNNFRMADKIVAVAVPPLVRGPDKASAACDKIHRKEGDVRSEAWELCREYSNRPGNGASRARMYGRIDLAMSPLYQYALPKRLPTAEEFVKLANDKLRGQGDGDSAADALVSDDRWRRVLFPITLPLHALDLFLPNGFFSRAAFKVGVKTGLINVADLRNKQVGNAYNQVFPGIFDASEGLFKLEDAFPEILLRNGVPALPSESLAQGAEDAVKLELVRQWNAVLDLYTRPVALFREGGWGAFRTDMSAGLTAALRGLSTQDPVQQACGSILLQRASAQALTLMGFERPVLETNPATRQSRLPPIANLLTRKEDTRLLVCDAGGLFIRHGRPLALTREELENYTPANQGHLELNPMPEAPALCRREQATPTAQGKRPDPNSGDPSRADAAAETVLVAPASDLIEMTSGAGHLLMALSPSSRWWKQTPWKQSPLTKFGEDLKALRASRAIVPVDLHALALALVSIGSTNLIDQNLVYVDKAFHEAPPGGDTVLGLRLSESPHAFGRGGVIRTRARAAALVADFAFKFPLYIDGLRAWAAQAHSETEIEDLYGSRANLDRLVATGKGSLRDDLDQLQFGVSMLLATLARRQPDGRLTCAAALSTDLDAGVESFEGFCSEAERALWKSALAHAAARFKSPQFEELSRP